MRTRMFIACATAALVLPATAATKEPTKATVEGPGLGGAITLTGDGGKPGTPLGDLTQQSGFAPAVFGHRNPDPMLRDRPAGELGPKYTVTYTIWGAKGDPVKQDVYPYATPTPLTYMAAGQEFHTGMTTYGGWFKADAALKKTFIAAGLPSVAPAQSGSDTSFGAPAAIGVIAFGLLAMGTAAIFLRRRLRHATA